MRTRSLAAVSAGSALGLAVLAHSLPAVTVLPRVRRRLFPRLSGAGRVGHVALTFDDGPDPKATPALLGELDRLGWKATFFMLGMMVDRDRGLAAEVAAAGHEIALHGYEHRNHLYRGPAAVLGDLRRGFDTVATATGTVPTLFRPPYGVLSSAGLTSALLIGLRPVLWTSWGRDWTAEATGETVLCELTAGVRSRRGYAGPTLLLHDSDCTSEVGSFHAMFGALPLLGEWANSEGWEVGTLTDHFQ